MTSPNHKAESSSYGYKDVYKYIKKIKRDSIVVHRINECDERKGTKNVNKFILNSNMVADATIFVSSWIKSLYLNQGFKSENSKLFYLVQIRRYLIESIKAFGIKKAN